MSRPRAVPSLIAVGLASLAAACSPPSPPSPPPAPAAAASAPAPVDAAPVATGPAWQRLRGAGLVGKDGYGLDLCGEASQRIAVLDPAAQRMLDAFLDQGARSFRFDGWGEPTAEGRVRVVSFERLAPEGLSCEESLDGFSAKAVGTEPFWAIEVAAHGTSLQRPDAPEALGSTRVLADSPTEKRYASDTGAGLLELTLVAGDCSDGMSDTLYGWTARASLAGESLAGCGYAGRAKLDR